MRVTEIQAGLAKIAAQLAAIEDEARALRSAIPDSPRRADMQEGKIAPDVATALLADLECLLADWLEPAIRIARDASQISAATLRREWRVGKRERSRKGLGRRRSGRRLF